MRSIKLAVMGLFVLALSALPQAQATITPTTLSGDITATATVIPVAAVTSASTPNYTAVVDGEAMTILAVNTTAKTLSVVRGAESTTARTHASGSLVYIAPSTYFKNIDPVGPCTATNETALPRIVIGGVARRPPSVSIYDCLGTSATTQRWTLYSRDGFAAFSPFLGSLTNVTAATYTTSTAITPQPGVVLLNGTTLAMTIVNPTLAQNGMVMVIEALNASAHTLTYTAGFNGGTTARDVATFGGAIGDNLVIFANNGVWWVISTRNVTFG